MQTIDEHNLANIMLDSGLLTTESLLNGSIEVSNVSQRNRNFVMVSQIGQSLFSKQGLGNIGLGSVANETKIYQFLQHPTFKNIRLNIPLFIKYQKENDLLVLEYMTSAITLSSYHLKFGRFPQYLASRMGEIFACLHHKNRLDEMNESQCLEKLPLPWVFTMHKPKLSMISELSRSSLELIRLIQEYDELCFNLEALTKIWKSNSLIHSDIKLDNVLMYKEDELSREYSIKLIDWEFSGIGDSLWDIASFFSSYLNYWVGTMLIVEGISIEKSIQLAKFPLNKMSTMFNIFWHKYTDDIGLSEQSRRDALTKTMQFTAARLVQTAYEQTLSSQEVNSNMICMVQISLNILIDPDSAGFELLGIKPRG